MTQWELCVEMFTDKMKCVWIYNTTINKNERIAGRQTPLKTAEPKKKRARNMFLAGDEDEYDV